MWRSAIIGVVVSAVVGTGMDIAGICGSMPVMGLCEERNVA